MDSKSPHIQLDPEQAYDVIAERYDSFTAHHDYDLWLENLLPPLEAHGLQGNRLLDAGCGTGKSSLPMLRRGWQVTACDRSRGMLSQLERKSEGRLRILHADLRELDEIGQFDLILCLGDVLNYCAATTSLKPVLNGLRKNLAPRGLLLFDLNTLTTYRTFYAEVQKVKASGGTVTWRGMGDGFADPGGYHESVMEIDRGDGRDVERAIHRQRHQGEVEAREAMDASNLECLDVFGQGFDGVLEQPLEEDRHTKAIFITKVRNPKEKRR